MASRETSSVLDVSGPMMWNRRVPIACECGYNRSQQDRHVCPKTGLHNHWNFPPFLDLPEENDISLDFYEENSLTGIYNPKQHWCLIAEVEDVMIFCRVRVQARTRYGERFTVHFHLDQDEGGQLKFCNYSALIGGKSTLCILYAHQHKFMDFTTGIRQESCYTVKVFPARLQELTDEVDKIIAVLSEPNKCVVCKKEAGPVSKRQHQTNTVVQSCGRCKVLRYCGKECQSNHWKLIHKKLCSHANSLRSLAQLDFSKFEGFKDWSFAPPSLTT